MTEGKAASTSESILGKSESTTGSRSATPLAQPPKQFQPTCPECFSQKLYKDGIRYQKDGSNIQRWLCRRCGYRFSQPNVKINVTGQAVKRPKPGNNLTHNVVSKFDFPSKEAVDGFSFFSGEDVASHMCPNVGQQLNSLRDYNRTRQVCEFLTEDSKNLATNETRTQEKAQRGANTTDSATIKGKIIEFLWWMEKEGFAKDTIRGYGSCLRALLQRNAELLEPESVKEALAKEKIWSQNRRRNVINAYTLFLKFNGSRWEKPRCKVDRKIPFIPTEQEIDCLIAGNPKKVATFLQLLKETAFRSGEAKRLLWTDIDFEKRLITLNQPEKNSLPGIYKVSQKLIDMLSALPRKSLKIFGDGPINSIKVTFIKARRRLAHKLQNPRLLQIHFHTLRHWKATMEYHRTKDIFHVKEFLRHKKLENIAIYVQIDERLFKDSDEGFTCRIAHNTGEAISLIEVGFEYVTGEYCDGGKLFRKRK